MTTKNTRSIWTSLILFVLLSQLACTSDPSGPDVSGIDIPFSVQRFDQDLFKLDTTQMEASLDELLAKYPDFLPFFINEIAHDMTQPDQSPLDAVKGFITAPPILRLKDSVELAFPNLDKQEPGLKQLLKHYRYYFPERPTPRIVTAVTEFIGDAYLVNDSLLMIGLDMFLGEDFGGYNPEFFPQFIRRQFVPENMTTKAAMAICSQRTGPPPDERILDYMINNGKTLYMMSKLMPFAPDSVIMGYTADQIAESLANEQNVWARMLDMGVLYEPLGPKNQKIVMPAPNATSVFTEAPGEIGNWIGWQIVKSYMKRNPDTSMDELIQLRDTQAFMEASKYKPPRIAG
ncbi:MAG: hypothetical protein R2792_17975 [Saprospiraceae bacterium]